jgi:P27 family predicted phage terminase small subunit
VRGQRPLQHPALLAGHRQQRELAPLGGRESLPVPRCPAGVLPATAKRWRELWKSRVSEAWDRQSDLPALTRYILLLDRWLRHDEMVRTAPMLRGSKDQLRANPLATRMDAIESQLRDLENDLGLTPAARVRLGISLVEARSALDRYLDGHQEDDDGEDDPRDLLMGTGAGQ